MNHRVPDVVKSARQPSHHPDETDRGAAEITYGYSKASIEDEITDGVVLCVNRHRVEHDHPPARVRGTDSV